MKKTDLGKPLTPDLKPVKRSFNKSNKGSSIKAPKKTSSRGTEIKTPKVKTGTTTKKAKKVKGPKSVSHKTKAPKKQPKRTRAEIAAAAEEKRLAKFEARQERLANKQLREYEKWLGEPTTEYNEIKREANRAIRDYKKAVREYNKEQRDIKRAESYEKKTQILKNKIAAEGRDPENFEESLQAMISNKTAKYASTSKEHREQLAEILGLEDTKLLDQYDAPNAKQFKEEIYMSQEDRTREQLIDTMRKLEKYERTERLHMQGIEETMDEETAKIIYNDIMNSPKVSQQTKDVLGILGYEGALIYVNYRQIQHLKFGKNWKEQFYNEAAATFWDDKGTKAALKKHGYRFGKKRSSELQAQADYFGDSLDASNLVKFAKTKMNPEDAAKFETAVKSLYNRS